MVNDQSIILNDNKADSSYMIAGISTAKDFMLIYTPLGKAISPDMTKLKSKNVVAYWFNPRDGKSKKIGEFDTSQKKEFKPWSVGRGSDFILAIIDKNSKYKIPEF